MPFEGSGWATAGYWPVIADEPGQLSQVLNRGSEQKLIRGAGDPAQPQPPEVQIALEMGERHLDLSALPSRTLKCFGSF
jgi:hypothetical protein